MARGRRRVLWRSYSVHVLKLGVWFVCWATRCSVDVQESGERSVLVLGKVTSMERNHAAVTTATAGSGSVAIKIEGTDEQSHITFGRHFDASKTLYSRVRYRHVVIASRRSACASNMSDVPRRRARLQITRASIDLLKESFRDQMSKMDWLLVKKLKEVFGIP